MNQIELHPFYAQYDAIENMKQYGTVPQAWGPLAEGKHGIFTHPVLSEIGEKYGKTAAQIALKWNAQRGVSIIPKSVHKERISFFYIGVEDSIIILLDLPYSVLVLPYPFFKSFVYQSLFFQCGNSIFFTVFTIAVIKLYRAKIQSCLYNPKSVIPFQSIGYFKISIAIKKMFSINCPIPGYRFIIHTMNRTMIAAVNDKTDKIIDNAFIYPRRR